MYRRQKIFKESTILETVDTNACSEVLKKTCNKILKEFKKLKRKKSL